MACCSLIVCALWLLSWVDGHKIERMDQNLRDRLRRLGVVKGTRHLKPASPPARELRQVEGAGEDVPAKQSLEALLPGGRLQETAVGACFVFDKVYPISHRHGGDHLRDLLALSPAPELLFCQDQDSQALDFRDFLFIDTETTGLAGTGTMAFMVGAAFFERAAEALVVRQYFLRDHGDEPAMLLLLDELLAERAGVITFNGRSFDLPLLDRRYLLNRMAGNLLDMPHLDLLPPSRRLWRYRLGSCALSALEQNLLEFQRSGEDIPGWLIPSVYNHYLRTDDTGELLRVFYHNRVDMLSMVTLASRVVRQFTQPQAADHPIDLFSLGKWLADLGLVEEAEETLRMAAAAELPLDFYHQALHRLGLLLKRNGRREEAVEIWQQIAATSFDEVEAHVELAKHYEWQHNDYPAAIAWTRRALALVEKWGQSGRAALVRDELHHRLARLQRKESPAD